LKFVGEQNATRLLDACGEQLRDILDSPEAVAMLVRKKVSLLL
jgi:hypothetical protein